MQSEDIFALGLGLKSPWKLMGQRFDMDKQPHELHLLLGAERGVLYPCPVCGALCKAHDFQEMSWRHLNFFQHLCILTANVPRVSCPEHGIHRASVPWARQWSGFSLLFEQVVMSLAREMPVNAVARYVGVTDKRVWRIVQQYVFKAMGKIDLSGLSGIALDETASKRGHNYVTVFLDMNREHRPVVFAVPGKGKACLKAFAVFLKAHGGNVDTVAEVVCDMSPAFIAAATDEFPNSSVTVDWFHVVKLFTDAMESVRREESKEQTMPKGARWAILKGDLALTDKQRAALEELQGCGFHTATAFRVKELLRWVRKADTRQGARWRASRFLKFARKLTGNEPILEPVRNALNTFEEHTSRILRHWYSLLSNARLEGMNGLFQAARARARGYRNDMTFISMIYLIGAPISQILWP